MSRSVSDFVSRCPYGVGCVGFPEDGKCRRIYSGRLLTYKVDNTQNSFSLICFIIFVMIMKKVEQS